MKRISRLGFTLIEVLVVVAILSILAAITTVNFNDARADARDAQRKSDLRTIEASLELYKQRWGRYPEGCNGADTWAGHEANYDCSGTETRYILGDTGRYFVPDFMPTLPTDPRPTGDNSGYVYRTNSEGSAFKLMSLRTVEQETIKIQDSHPFVSCARSLSVNGAVCDQVYFNSGNAAPKCDNGNAVFRSSYGLWGGYPHEPFTSGQRSEEQLENVVCRMP